MSGPFTMNDKNKGRKQGILFKKQKLAKCHNL